MISSLPSSAWGRCGSKLRFANRRNATLIAKATLLVERLAVPPAGLRHAARLIQFSLSNRFALSR
jgi:hypothetical protein